MYKYHEIVTVDKVAAEAYLKSKDLKDLVNPHHGCDCDDEHCPHKQLLSPIALLGIQGELTAISTTVNWDIFDPTAYPIVRVEGSDFLNQQIKEMIENDDFYRTFSISGEYMSEKRTGKVHNPNRIFLPRACQIFIGLEWEETIPDKVTFLSNGEIIPSQPVNGSKWNVPGGFIPLDEIPYIDIDIQIYPQVPFRLLAGFHRNPLNPIYSGFRRVPPIRIDDNTFWFIRDGVLFLRYGDERRRLNAHRKYDLKYGT